MQDILIAVYERKDNYKGYSKINHYHIVTELRAYVCDCTEERNIGILVNGKPCPDTYDVVEYNYKGEVIYRHHFVDRNKANSCVKSIIANIGGFKRIQ